MKDKERKTYRKAQTKTLLEAKEKAVPQQ